LRSQDDRSGSGPRVHRARPPVRTGGAHAHGVRLWIRGDRHLRRLRRRRARRDVASRHRHRAEGEPMRRGLIVVVSTVAVGALAFGVVVETRSKRTFTAMYPPVAASTDPAVVARGQYLIYGPAACAYCHVPKERWTELDAGVVLPLSGNHVFRLP